MFYSLWRRLLFFLPAESAHKLALSTLKYGLKLKLIKSRAVKPPPINSPWQLMGIPLTNPVGLAAGLDKNGDYINTLAALGFGFIEVGTVTPKAQAGNPKPRLFRLIGQRALFNRMGFNNKGVAYLSRQIQKANFYGVLGVNIGKNAATPIENAAADYLICLQKVYPYAAYVTVNISSPNTKNLRDLQDKEQLYPLLAALKKEQRQLAVKYNKYVPLAVKIAPDLTPAAVAAVAAVLIDLEIDGVICTNTTLDKALIPAPYNQEKGGLSGAPLLAKANQVLAQTVRELQGKIPVIGTGGIMTGQQAADKLALGAAAVQIYSGLIYAGPDLIKEAVSACRKTMGNKLSPEI